MTRTPNSKMKLGEEMSSAKKIGLFACTGVVAGNIWGAVLHYYLRT